MTQSSQTSAAYTPGACNIGSEEIARRYRIGWLGLLMAILWVAATEYWDGGFLWRLALAVPVGFSLSGFIQARARFCFAYGLRGVYSTEGRRVLRRVEENRNAAIDKKRSIRLFALSVGGGLLAGVLYLAIWHFL